MKAPKRTKIWLLPIAILILVQCKPPNKSFNPDLVLVNGKIITVDSTDQIVEALAIKDGKILAIGSSEEIAALAGEITKKIDLAGRTVTPGLLDSHIHLSSSPWNSPDVVDLSYPNAKSIVEIKQLISEQVDKVSPGEWVQADGLDEGKLEEQRLILAEELDEVSPENPVWLSHTTGHYGVANTKALELAGINDDTPNPPEGIIERNSKGEANGTLKESAMGFVYRKLPPITVKDIEGGVAHMIKALNSEGMTGIKDPTVNEKRWKAYKNVLKSDSLNLRVFGLAVNRKFQHEWPYNNINVFRVPLPLVMSIWFWEALKFLLMVVAVPAQLGYMMNGTKISQGWIKETMVFPIFNPIRCEPCYQKFTRLESMLAPTPLEIAP